MVLIEGEPGIGKTRFLAEILADPAGLRPFHADADELERTRPFGSLVDALGCQVSSADPLRAEIARLIDAGAGEFRIVERFAELLERIALEAPLLVVVDDFQWADPSTVTSLRFAARHLADVPANFVLAFRPIPRVHELASFVDRSIRDGALHVTLGPLDERAVVGLVEDLLGRPPGAGLRTLVAGAAGSPFYVTELVDGLDADGRLRTVDGLVEADAVSVPVSFRGSIVRYLRFLGDSRLSVLRWAAVHGSRFSPSDLAGSSGMSIDEVLPVLDDAVRASILVHDGDRLAFRHDLLREALYEDIGVAVRQSLHLQAGRYLAAAGGTPLEVAHHLLRGPETEDNMAVDWLLAAAHQTIDLDTKAELLERALDRCPAVDRRSAEIGAKAIVIMGQTGRMADAQALADRLRASLAERDAAVLNAALAEAYAHLSDPVGVLRHCGAVRDRSLLSVRDRNMVLANEGFGLLLAGRLDEAEAAAHRAVEAGESAGTMGAIHAGRRLLCLCALSSGRGREAAAVAAQTATSWPSDYGQVVLQMALVNEDRLTEAEESFSTAQHRIVEGGHITAQAMLQATRARALLLAGRLDDAMAQAETALALGDQARLSAVASEARGVIARVALHRGAVEDAETTLGPVPALPGLGVDLVEWDRALVLIYKERGELAARQVLSSAWQLFRPLRYLISWVSFVPDLVRLHVAAGERDLAASVTEAVEVGAAGSDVPSATGAALRCRALTETDPVLMQEAVNSYELGPRVLETAAAREDAASLTGGTEAVDHLRKALLTYEAAGAAGDATRVRAALRTRGVRVGVRGTRQRPATGWQSLTPTERRVVALAAQGLTSRQIGDRLYIASFTVGSHLRHVYQKLGINTRLQLAAEMRHHEDARTDVG